MFFHVIVLTILLTAIFSALGRVLIERCGLRGEEPLFYMMLSPAIGAAFWLGTTLFLGITFSYGKPLLLLCSAALIIYLCRFRRDIGIMGSLTKGECSVLLLILAAALVTTYPLIPLESGGSVYFSAPIYDHVKAGIVDSIARNGLPPLSPFLADDGTPVLLTYYYGWHALAAQLGILFGISGFTADAALTAFTTLTAILLMGAFAYKLSGAKRSVLWTLFLFLILFPIDMANKDNTFPWLLPLIATENYPGFWGLIDNCIWVPQHIFSASLVIVVVYLAALIIQQGRMRPRLVMLASVLAAASFYTSVYAGIFAFALFFISLLVCLPFSAALRESLLKAAPSVAAAAAITLIMSVSYLLYLFNNSPAETPLLFGVYPAYESGGLRQFVYGTLHLFLVTLPVRLGVIYVGGMAVALGALSFKKSDRLTAFFLKLLCLAPLLSAAFIHSSFYTNDYGWRTTTASELILYIFTAVLLERSWENISARVKLPARAAAVFVLGVTAASFVVFMPETVSLILSRQRTAPEIHRVCKGAIAAWDEVKAHTRPDDLALTNPDGFFEVLTVKTDDNYSTNFFQLLYADRGTPLSDLIFAKCYSEFYDDDKLKKRYGELRRIFSGEVRGGDADYLADELRTAAIVVTPLDGLWHDPGALGARFEIISEKDDYRIYLKKKQL